jgi:superfamily I DNA/RNA helicase
MLPGEMVIFVRSEAQLARADDAARHTGLPYERLTHEMKPSNGSLSICPMHLAKGLEFRAVAVMACDQDALPDPERIAMATDPNELQDVYNSERQLLYVACTRARDALLLSSTGVPSEFVDDTQG